MLVPKYLPKTVGINLFREETWPTAPESWGDVIIINHETHLDCTLERMQKPYSLIVMILLPKR